MLSLLVDAAESGKLANLGATPTDLVIAVLRLLELNPNITRWDVWLVVCFVDDSCHAVTAPDIRVQLLARLQGGAAQSNRLHDN